MNSTTSFRNALAKIALILSFGVVVFAGESILEVATNTVMPADASYCSGCGGGWLVHLDGGGGGGGGGGGDGGGGGGFTPYCTLTLSQNGTQQYILSWTAPYATSFSIDRGIGAVTPAAGGTQIIGINAGGVYTGTAVTPYGTVQCSTTYTPPPPTCTLTSQSMVDGAATLSWTTVNGTTFSINQGIGSVTPVSAGTRSVAPTVTTTYTGTVVGAGGTATCSTTVVYTPPGACKLEITKTVNKTSVTPGEQVEYTISFVNSGGAKCTGSGVKVMDTVDPRLTYVVGSETHSSNVTAGYMTTDVYLASDRTLRWNAWDLDPGETGWVKWTGTVATPTQCSETIPNKAKITSFEYQNFTQFVESNQVDITVSKNCNTVPYCTLSALPSTVYANESSTLTWTTLNATSISIDQGVGSVSPVAFGSKTVNVPSTKTYTATVTGPGGTATCSTTVTVVTPPTQTCGLDIALVLDTSNSIDAGELAQMKGAFNNFVDVLIPATPTQFSVTKFDILAQVLQGFTTSGVTTKNAINGATTGSWTNWEQGLLVANGTYDPRPSIPNVILFASDGRPNHKGNPAQNVGETAALNAAVTAANSIKASGTRIITLGIGDNLSAANLQSISSPGDYYTTADFSTLGSTLQNLAGELCGGTITVKKIIDADGNLSTTNDQTPGENWTFTVAGNQRTTAQNGMTMPVEVTPGTYSVTESQQSGYSLVGATCTGGVQNGSLSGSTVSGIQVGGSSIVSCVFYNKPSQHTPLCTLSATPSNVGSGNASTLSWTTVNASSITIDQGIGSKTPISAGSVVVNPTTTTTYTATVVGPGGTVNCQTTVTVNTPGPSCTLSVSRSQIRTGESVTVSWTSTNATEGFISGGVGSTSPVSAGTSIDIFPPDDTTYTGTFKGPQGTVSCSVFVDVQTGGGGCQGNCGGGGLNQPNVVMFQKPGDAPLAFVSLSQIPYTGFSAGPALTAIFWFAVMMLAALSTYFVMGRGGLQFVLGNAFQLVGVVVDSEDRNEYSPARAMPQTTAHAESGAYNMSATVAAAPVTVAPAQVQRANDGIPEINDVIESRAHAAGVLMSPEAIQMTLALSADRGEMLRMFGDILNEAVKTIPREDGWILLTSDRFDQIKNRTPKAPTLATPTQTPSVEEILASVMTPQPAKRNVEMPMASADDQSVVMNLARTILSGDREQAYATARTLEANGANATSVMTIIATAFDQLFRARRHGTTTELTMAAQSMSDESLAKIVEIFAHGMDHGYANAYTGLKLAIAQAFEARA